MSRYEQLFANLDKQHQGAFVPFVTLGDPTPEVSVEVIKRLIDAGADALELGLPFSDPVADGPVIQRANVRALDGGTRFEDCLSILKQVREYAPDIPIGLLVYANLIFAKGIDTFYEKMAAVGVDSVLVADLPTKEAIRFSQPAIDRQVAPVFICPPDASDSLIEAIAKQSQGYVYLLSRSGVTGTETQMQVPAEKLIAQLRSAGSAPIMLGFGISQPEHVKATIKAGAQGAISGSAVVAIIEKNLDNTARMLDQLGQFVESMKSATSQ
ncbi:tryptophan synthase subunit alpha [Idiomarina sp.]|uniref:tryptophan synthase subunit alpha n=1 Tax=Idiomarina sp. TaxID=1874361 RepID=UPI0025C46FE2|nr:tryptophan synthase subunit alpha [Idiomarina sp.]NQZ04147.1 tryptophan synthase subunit alpha [Idiomarina sp.]